MAPLSLSSELSYQNIGYIYIYLDMVVETTEVYIDMRVEPTDIYIYIAMRAELTDIYLDMMRVI